MHFQAILFDLDGTLLPMDQDRFVRSYLSLLAQKAAGFGYEPKALLDTVWAGIFAMVNNDGSATNEQAFWREFEKSYPGKSGSANQMFLEFYGNEFKQSKASCGCNPAAAETVHTLWKQGYRVALATNPVFPPIATETRMGWAGLTPADFELFTTYDNSHYCKPNPAYFAEILEKMQLNPEDCLMVGNDIDDDGGALKLGMQVFFLTDHLINRKNADLSHYHCGGFAELMRYIAAPG